MTCIRIYSVYNPIYERMKKKYSFVNKDFQVSYISDGMSRWVTLIQHLHTCESKNIHLLLSPNFRFPSFVNFSEYACFLSIFPALYVLISLFPMEIFCHCLMDWTYYVPLINFNGWILRRYSRGLRNFVSSYVVSSGLFVVVIFLNHLYLTSITLLK